MWKYLKRWAYWGDPLWLTRAVLQPLARALPLSVLLLMLSGLYCATLTPVDYQQGIAFRIFYLHVPCAVLSTSLYALLGLCSIFYIIWRHKIFLALALALAPVGATMTVIVLWTGMMWGRPMWGTWWVWDARLTSQALLWMLYMGYIALTQSFSRPKTGYLIASYFAVLGLLDLPVIRYSVVWWQSLHQGSTLLQWAKPSIEGIMLLPLVLTIASTFFWSACMIAALMTKRIEVLYATLMKRHG